MSLDVVDMRGEPRARGVAYGRARAVQIERCLADWLRSLGNAGIAEPRAHVARLIRDTSFLRAIESHTPDLLDEVRGVAEGAGVPFELLYAAQLMDEEWAYRSSVGAAEKCSSVAVRVGDSGVIIGQNMDLGGYTDGHQCALRIAPDGPKPGAVVFSISSMIGLMGVNTAAVGVCVNSIPQVPADREGLPVAFVIRRLLQATSLDEAVRLVRELPHATGQHYLLADPSGIRSFEAAAGRVVEYQSPYDARVLHTNHPLAAGWGEMEYSANSVARLRSLERRLATDAINVEEVKAALSSRDDAEHPVSRVVEATSQPHALTGMISFTTGSMISTLARATDAVDSWISAGPPSIRPYTHVTFA